MCDASDFAVGAVLGQRIDKNLNVIHYASKTLDSAQINYATFVPRKSDTGSKGYPLLRFGTGREGGCRSLHPEKDHRR